MEEALWKAGRVPGEVELAFGVAGAGGNPVIALHGITAQHRAFNALARHLRGEHLVVAPDLRGRGDSASPFPGNYGLPAHAADAIRVMDHMGLERAVLMGHSMGGFVSVRAALDYPERVSALVLLDGGRPRQPEGVREPDLEKGLEHSFSRLGKRYESIDDYLDFFFPGQNMIAEMLPPDLADYYIYDLRKAEGHYIPKASDEAVTEDAEAITQGPTAEEMKGVRCPVALVRAPEGLMAGSAPLITDAMRDEMADSLDLRAELMLEGANHYSMMLDPHAQRTASFVQTFLASL